VGWSGSVRVRKVSLAGGRGRRPAPPFNRIDESPGCSAPRATPEPQGPHAPPKTSPTSWRQRARRSTCSWASESEGSLPDDTSDVSKPPGGGGGGGGRRWGGLKGSLQFWAEDEGQHGSCNTAINAAANRSLSPSTQTPPPKAPPRALKLSPLSGGSGGGRSASKGSMRVTSTRRCGGGWLGGVRRLGCRSGDRWRPRCGEAEAAGAAQGKAGLAEPQGQPPPRGAASPLAASATWRARPKRRTPRCASGRRTGDKGRRQMTRGKTGGGGPGISCLALVLDLATAAAVFASRNTPQLPWRLP
jgi:hypothetical protein